MAFCTPIVVKDEPVFVCDREVDTALYTNSGRFDTDRKCTGRGGIFGGKRPYVRGSHNNGGQKPSGTNPLNKDGRISTCGQWKSLSLGEDCQEKESSALVSQDDVPCDIEEKAFLSYVIWSTH